MTLTETYSLGLLIPDGFKVINNDGTDTVLLLNPNRAMPTQNAINIKHDDAIVFENNKTEFRLDFNGYLTLPV